MRRMKPFGSLPFISLLPTLILAGCISAGNLSGNAMKYNEAVEEAQNKMLLLNIIRAKLFRPLYITDLSKITGSIKLDINSGGIETDYGPYTMALSKGKSGLTSGKLIPSLDYVNNPIFEVNVFSTQDFMRGFLSPATKDLLAYYWEQGWPPEFLLYLFVHHVNVKTKEGAEMNYENYPDPDDKDLGKLEAFGRWVTEFVSKRPSFVREQVTIGRCLEEAQVSDLDDLVKATKEGLSLTDGTDGCYKLLKPKPELCMVLLSDKKTKSDEKTKGDEKAKEDEKAKTPCSGKGSPGSVSAVSEEGETTTLYLKSPDGMIFYLGELMRVEERFNKVPAACIGGKLWPIFVAFAKHSDSNCPSSVAAVYEGTEFIIPDRRWEKITKWVEPGFECPKLGIRQTEGTQPAKEWSYPPNHKKYIDGLESLDCFGGMSTESFSLLTQLIALQKSAKDVPTTSVIRAIAQ